MASPLSDTAPPDANTGNKVYLPPSVLGTLSSLPDVKFPFMFGVCMLAFRAFLPADRVFAEIRRVANSGRAFAGVMEFTADEGPSFP